MKKIQILAAAMLALAITGCVHEHEPVTYRPTGARSADGARTWWIASDEPGHEHLVLCDPAFLARYGYACVKMTP